MSGRDARATDTTAANTAEAGGAVAAWGAVVQEALLGTARGGTTSTVTPGGSPERGLLDRAAVLATVVGAGRLPPAAPPPGGPGADPAPAAADDLPVCPSAAAGLLATILAGAHREVFPEWLDHARAAGCRVPSALLPAVLDLLRATPSANGTPPALDALGGRGRWLAAQRPEWTFARTPNAESDRARWDAGAPAEREEALGRLRRADAGGARDLLAAAWPREGAAARARLLAVLADGLGPDDEPLLERALDDRSRQVRDVAADLLATLPGSAFVARAIERARGVLRTERGGLLRRARLEVTPPGPPDTAAARDGVQAAAPVGIGERAWWLAQVIALVPPAVWTEALGATSQHLVELAALGEWEGPLVDAWARAALRHHDAAWIDALLRAGALVDRHRRLAPTRAELLAALPAADREQFVADALAGRVHVDDVEGLLAATPGPWGEAFARAVLAWVRRRAGGDGRGAGVLRQFALAAPPVLAEEVAGGWPEEVEPRTFSPESLARQAFVVEQRVAVLKFRGDLAATFAP